ncbi:hypothetical protein [Oceanirhabdus sp. W0125-5]|nr:hypothetical protein [Oceanirhabdus sp. W0125-5]WBW94959.1 hypothetical protein OW730_14785 [Oceanirhabdus sp. W0125-5]
MKDYEFANLTEDQKLILQNAEKTLNEGRKEPILIIAYDSKE